MIFFKGCDRCGGELMTGSDQSGDHIKCLMCSRFTYVRKEWQAHARWLIREQRSRRPVGVSVIQAKAESLLRIIENSQYKQEGVT
jgi:hypothetical protein